jgi:hypothetical protein
VELCNPPLLRELSPRYRVCTQTDLQNLSPALRLLLLVPLLLPPHLLLLVLTPPPTQPTLSDSALHPQLRILLMQPPHALPHSLRRTPVGICAVIEDRLQLEFRVSLFEIGGRGDFEETVGSAGRVRRVQWRGATADQDRRWGVREHEEVVRDGGAGWVGGSGESGGSPEILGWRCRRGGDGC